jgi:hypothetical protein
MKPNLQFFRRHWSGVLWGGVGLALLVGLAVTYDDWWPRLRELATHPPAEEDGHEGHGHDHAGHDDGHAHGGEAHNEENALELKPAAWKNIGLKTGNVQPRNFTRTVPVPAMIVERPGRSQVVVAAPLTGIVTRVHPLEGEAVVPTQPLFELRLTHTELAEAQRDLLQSLQEYDVSDRELKLLKTFDKSVVEGGRIRTLEYQLEKLNGLIHARRQGLLAFGLTETQIDEIISTRKLIQKLTLTAPPFAQDGDHSEIEHLFVVRAINVKPGQAVAAGDSLAHLGDHCVLYVEGQAFEDDAPRLQEAAKANRPLDVAQVAGRNAAGAALSLPVLYIADHVDEDSRALHFYLPLSNQIVRDVTQNGHRFVTWKYRPGERMEVKLPLGEPWLNQIVLPPEAVVQEGTDEFVFEQNGPHFDRVAVHVIYRDKDSVVVENDGSLAGATLAISGAYQMHLALKNKSGGAVDPHAGHSH